MVDCGAGYFPKCDGWTLYSEDVNLLYGNFVGMRSTEAETAMNIAKLQYCQSVTDINHDYMVVDVFTDANGYNDTVCTADTTSQYCSSGLNGYYINNNVCQGCIIGSIINCNLAYMGNYFAGIPCNNTYCVTRDILTCISSVNININSFDSIIFCINYNGYIDRFTSCLFTRTIGSHDDKCFNITVFPGDGNISKSYTCLICYCYKKVNTNYFDFYCDGVCKCQVNLTNFPNICLCAYQFSYESGGYKYGEVCLFNLFGILDSQSKNIKTIPITYSSSIKTIYFSLDKIGVGTVVYNVIDVSTGNCIACNLLPNCFYELDCCIQCHYYVLKQCSDGVSCIKSYAIVTGVY